MYSKNFISIKSSFPKIGKELSDCRQTISCLPLAREVARHRRDGGRENALMKPFLTTPQSPTVTAPLTMGAENWLCRHPQSSFPKIGKELLG